MKRRLFKLFLILLIAAGIAFLLVRGDGYLLIAYGTKTIEMTLWVAALLVAGIMLFFWFARQLLRGGVEMARRLREIFFFGSVERAQKRAATGMVDYLTGDWFEARKKLLRTLDKVEYPLANYLAAARASFEMGEQKEAEELLEKALSFPHSELAVALTRARLMVQAGRHDDAVALLKPIELRMPRQPAVLDLMHHIYMAQKNWRALSDLLPALRKAKVLSVQEAETLDQLLAVEKLRELGDTTKSQLIAERLPALQSAWKSLSRSAQRDPVVVTAYVRALAENYQDQEAEVVARKALNTTWHGPLIALYGRLQVKDLQPLIRHVENWLRDRPSDATLLLAAAHLYERNHQLETAREFYQRSLNQQSSIEALSDLAQLMIQLGDHKKSAELYQQSVALSSVKPN